MLIKLHPDIHYIHSSTNMTPLTLITKFYEEVYTLIKNHEPLLSQSTTTINIADIESRESLRCCLTELQTSLKIATDYIDDSLQRVQSAHNKDLVNIGNLLQMLKIPQPTQKLLTLPLTALPDVQTVQISKNNIKLNKQKNSKPEVEPVIDTSGNGEWSVVTRKKPESKNANRPLITNFVQPLQAQPAKSIKITQTLSLDAIEVGSFDEVKQDGNLYYIPAYNHFAIRIAGRLLHGNIGNIYTNENSPKKIKDCNFALSCMKQTKCDYYHDPALFANSTDIRDYFASSWLYAPPDSHYKNRPRSRRFGSREHLDIDIVAMQPDEINRFHDQTMHDLLCSLLIP